MAIMTLEQIVNDTDLAPSQKARLLEAVRVAESVRIFEDLTGTKKKYLVFKDVTKPGKITKTLEIYNTNNEALGLIKWYGPWRKYTADIFGTYDKGCLTEIVNQINELERERKIIIMVELGSYAPIFTDKGVSKDEE
jgi:hypothetical protein